MIQNFVDMSYKLGHFILGEIIRLSNLIIELCEKVLWFVICHYKKSKEGNYVEMS